MKNNKKVFVLASVLLFSGFLLGGNSQVVKAAGETDTASVPTSDSVEYDIEGSNVITSDDGTVSADITYNGVQYSVKGRIGTTVKAMSTDGSGKSVEVSIIDRKSSEVDDSSSNYKVNLLGIYSTSYQVFNSFGKEVKGEYVDGGKDYSLSQKMTLNDDDYDKKNSYYLIGDGKWIKPSFKGTTISGTDNFTLKSNPYFAINKSNPITYDDSEWDNYSMNSDGTVEGTVKKYSYEYKKDIEYNFKGSIGQTVDATLTPEEDTEYDLNPIKVKIANKPLSKDFGFATISLSGSGKNRYELYLCDDYSNYFFKEGSEYPGNTAFFVPIAKVDRDGDIFYEVTQSEWIKQEDGVELSTDFDYTPEPYIEIVQNQVITSSVTFPSNLGEKTVSDITGEVGDNLTVPVPTISGYKADKSTVSAHVNAEGTITTKDSVKYTPIKSNSGSSSNTDRVKPEYLKQTVSTFPDKPNVKLYHLNADSMTADDTRALAPNSDWQSDQRVVVKGDTYYRVATNEWVKASQAYIYTAHPIVVETKLNGIKKLASAEGNTVTDRALASDTDWYSDRIAYLNDGTTEYYRVATNEFVKQSDVNEISK